MNSNNLFKWSGLFLLFLFSVQSIQAQQSQQQTVIDTAKIKCIYQLRYQPDSMDNKNIRTESMLLLIGHSVSRFQSLNSYLFDSVKNNFKDKNPMVLLGVIKNYRTSFRYRIYKNYPRGKISLIENLFRDYFLIEQSMNLFNWKITTDTATVSGYHCQKATTRFAGRDYIAWFTLEVPVSEGPYKFNGLPGLIVKIGDTRQQYVFSLISLQQFADPVPIYFTKREYIKTTLKKFNKAQRDLFNNLSERLAAKGVKITLTSSGKPLKKVPPAKNALEIEDEY